MRVKAASIHSLLCLLCRANTEWSDNPNHGCQLIPMVKKQQIGSLYGDTA